MDDDIELSVVVPAHNEEGSLEELVARLQAVLGAETDRFEIIVVDDGSTDGTGELLGRLSRSEERVHRIALSRNFGHQAALLAGLSSARGAAVVMMDADLQHPPEVIHALVARWREGFEVVHTIREDSRRSAGPLKRATSRAFYRLLRTRGTVQLEAGMADFRLASKAVVEVVVRSSSARPFLRGAFVWVGFRQTAVTYHADPRSTGASSYTLRRMLQLALDGLLSFGDPPLHWPVLAGVATSLAAFTYGAYAVVVALTSEAAVPGWASIAVLVSILFGLLFLLLGAVGAYLVAIYRDTRGTPAFVIASDSREDATGSQNDDDATLDGPGEDSDAPEQHHRSRP